MYWYVIAVGLAAMIAAPVAGGTVAVWGGLEPGPYAVGFRTIEKYDYSRTFQPAKDYYGNPIEGGKGRPVQVCFWYPAAPTDGPRMVYSEYAFPYPSDQGFFPLLSQLQSRELGTLFFFMGNSQAQVSNLMNMELMAVRDAAAAQGTFPLIVYHGNERSAYSQNAVMSEYLASHGFVVATTHTIGMADPNPTERQSDLEAIIRDKEWVVALMREQTGVDCERLGLIGYDYGGVTALLHQMRNYSVDAVATLQGRFLNPGGATMLTTSASYEPLRLQIPWLQIYTENPQLPIDRSLVDSLKYSKRYSVLAPHLRPNEFSTYGLMAAVMGIDTTREPQSVLQAHAAVCQYLLRFFDAHLRDNEASLAWLGNSPETNGFGGQEMTLVTAQGEPVPPTQDQFVTIIQNYGLERARELSTKFNLINPENPILSDANFNRLGYEFLLRGEVAPALQLFQWCVISYPRSANAWDSYGEACAANGDLELALVNYRKAQETIPGDSTLTPQMRQALEGSATTNITRLEQQISERARPGGSEGNR